MMDKFKSDYFATSNYKTYIKEVSQSVADATSRIYRQFVLDEMTEDTIQTVLPQISSIILSYILSLNAKQNLTKSQDELMEEYLEELDIKDLPKT